jgi:hypothetical protein
MKSMRRSRNIDLPNPAQTCLPSSDIAEQGPLINFSHLLVGDGCP